jgi:hypothetical protein
MEAPVYGPMMARQIELYKAILHGWRAQTTHRAVMVNAKMQC